MCSPVMNNTFHRTNLWHRIPLQTTIGQRMIFKSKGAYSRKNTVYLIRFLRKHVYNTFVIKFHMDYCNHLFFKSRLTTENVTIGNTNIGGSNPILVQSMTTADTMNTQASVAEAIRMIDAGCELVRLTAPVKTKRKTSMRLNKH